jgi:hypothetical protein
MQCNHAYPLLLLAVRATNPCDSLPRLCVRREIVRGAFPWSTSFPLRTPPPTHIERELCSPASAVLKAVRFPQTCMVHLANQLSGDMAITEAYGFTYSTHRPTAGVQIRQHKPVNILTRADNEGAMNPIMQAERQMSQVLLLIKQHSCSLFRTHFDFLSGGFC